MEKYKINNSISLKRRVSLCRALSEPQRWLILQHLLEKDEACIVGELVARLKIAHATVSHHLQQLELAGLITRRRRGRFIYCKAQRNSLGELAGLFQQLSGHIFVDNENPQPALSWSDSSFVWS